MFEFICVKLWVDKKTNVLQGSYVRFRCITGDRDTTLLSMNYRI